MGAEMLPADANNRPGYFEDLSFLELNRRMLASVVSADLPRHADWGWTEGVAPAGVDPRLLDPFVAEADALLADRAEAQAETRGLWGWKDPRTTVLLDFWDARLADARYVFIYRPPWDVADSMQRIGATEFLRHPEFAYRIWHHYNRALLDFTQRHRDRTLLVSVAAVMRRPETLLELVEERFGMSLAREGIADVADPSLMVSTDGHLAALAGAAYPECAGVLRELEASADLPSGVVVPSPLTAPSSANEPRVSIVIPYFDDGPFLLEAIASVEDTVFVPYELIVVNDGSADRHSLEILAALRRAGYRIIDQENRGLAEARNRGIRQARGPLLLPLDADNRLLPGFVEAALDVLDDDPAIMAVYGDRVEFGVRSCHVTVGVPDLNRLLCGNYIDACAVIRRDAWQACGGYDTEMPVQGMEDWDFWLSMLEHEFTLHRLDMDTFEYRVRPESVLVGTLSEEVQATIERYVLAKHAPFYLQHLRRQVDRLDSMAMTVTELEAQLTRLTSRTHG
jgi:hypothetical protein